MEKNWTQLHQFNVNYYQFCKIHLFQIFHNYLTVFTYCRLSFFLSPVCRLSFHFFNVMERENAASQTCSFWSGKKKKGKWKVQIYYNMHINKLVLYTLYLLICLFFIIVFIRLHLHDSFKNLQLHINVKCCSKCFKHTLAFYKQHS